MEEQSDDPLVEFGKHLGDLLTYHGVSQSELARKIDELTKDIVSQMIAGSRSRLTPRNMLRFLEGLILLEKITEPETIYWWKQLHIARAEEYKYRPLEEIPKGRALLDLIKRIQEPPQKALEQQFEKSEYRTQQGLPLIGRERDIAIVIIKLQEEGVRFLNLVGSPGVGKSELAWQIEELAHAHGYLRSVHSLSLEGISEIDGALNKIKRLIRGISNNERTLLVLDNCDEIAIVDRATTELYTLLREREKLTILATSRYVFSWEKHEVKPLELPEYRDLTIEKLKKYDAIRLFIDSAKRYSEDFNPSEQEAKTMADLCIALDGLPLALNMAATWVKDLGIEKLYKRLLQGDMQDIPYDFPISSDRHITLDALIAFSYNLLRTKEKALLRRLAIFNISCEVELAATICDLGDLTIERGELIQIARTLRKHHLITFDEEWLEIAHNTIRRYALRQLREMDEEKSIWRQFFNYFIELGEGRASLANKKLTRRDYYSFGWIFYLQQYNKLQAIRSKTYLTINDEYVSDNVRKIFGEGDFQELERFIQRDRTRDTLLGRFMYYFMQIFGLFYIPRQTKREQELWVRLEKIMKQVREEENSEEYNFPFHYFPDDETDKI